MSDPRDAQFKHEPLDLKQAVTICLIEIVPSGPADTVACRVRHATTDADYTLPKTFGTSSGLQAHASNIGISHESGFNFEEATKSFWIDALCIDQDNNSEKNHQVQQMGKIFSNAQRVIAWMGSNPHFAALFHYMRDNLKAQHFFDADHYLTLHDFCKDSYWTRAWVIQEVLLARQVLLLADTEAVNLAYLWDEVQKSIHRTFCSSIQAELWKPIKYTAIQDQQRPLLENMMRFQTKRCQNRLDLVYSLRSISLDGASLRVEYGISMIVLARHVLELFREDLCLWRVITVLQTLHIPEYLKDPTTPDESFRILSESTQPFMDITLQAWDESGGLCEDCKYPITLPLHKEEYEVGERYLHCYPYRHYHNGWARLRAGPVRHLLVARLYSVDYPDGVWSLFCIDEGSEHTSNSSVEIKSGTDNVIVVRKDTSTIVRVSLIVLCEMLKKLRQGGYLRQHRHGPQKEAPWCGWELTEQI